MKFILRLLLLCFLVNCVYSNTFISEINFLDNEFVELYSNTTLNLTNTLFFDDAGINQSNTLSLIQNKNSSFYLIVGENFLNTYNFSNLNCSIYFTQKSELGYRNLKNSAENITLILNESLNLSFIKTDDLNFGENQTLNYNYYTKTYFITNRTLCALPPLNQTNLSNISIKKIKPNIDFQIILNKQIFENKIQFKFQTNATNYTIEYWIEDYQGNIVKSKYNTTNSNTKSYTPSKQIQIYTIFATLYFQNYTYIDTKTITFYYFEKPLNITNQTNNCIFDIDLKTEFFFQDKLEYSFVVPKNDNNFTIQYWIQDLEGNIIKEIKNTTNKNKKSYTPKTNSNIFNVSANYISQNCNISTSKLALFYKKYEETTCEIQSNYINPLTDPNSYIKILNQEELKNQTTNILKYEIYKGDTLKRVINFNLNNQKITSFELAKFSKLTGQISLEYTKKVNELKIIGLDKELNLLIISNNNFTTLPQINQNQKVTNLQIKNLTQNLFEINFNLITSIQNLTGECYLNLVKTKISDSINISNLNLHNLILKINDTKLTSKNNQNTQTLKLTCKYKKAELKTYNYESLEFNYSIPLIKKTVAIFQNLLMVDSNNNFNNIQNPIGILSTFQINETKKPIVQKEVIKKEEKIETIDEFQSKNQKLSQNSFFGIFLGVVLILFIFLIRW